jgi:hypothetical protein
MAISLNLKEPPPDEFPCLKSGCRFRSETFHGTPFQVLEDPATGNFFRLGEAEADFLRRLDGSLRISQILERKTSALGDRQRRELLELAARAGIAQRACGSQSAQSLSVAEPALYQDSVWQSGGPVRPP